MKGKIFLSILLSLCIVIASLWAVNSSFRIKGIFNLNNGWSGISGNSFLGGNPGKVSFNSGGSEILSDGTLSGSFWMGNVGWVSFSHGITGSGAQIHCPSNVWNDATQPCPMSGSAWSQNAGWIVFGASDIGTGSGAYFDPNTGNFSGWGWSRSLGWVPFWSGITSLSVPSPAVPIDPLSGIPINFISKIAIVGNIAGSHVYSVVNSPVVNQDVGYSYNTVNHADILNMIRKNIALMSRNVEATLLSNNASSLDFIIVKDQDYRIDYGWNVSNNKRSIIVIGGDIVIDQENVNSLNWSNSAIGLIALKDASGKGGNIVISKNVKKIFAYMYAEASVFSGEKTDSTHPIIPYTNAGVWNIPQNQLYIRGLVASKNTVGGAQQKPDPICPALTSNCDATTAYAYDWDYFRTYDPTDPTQDSLPSERSGNAKLKDATMIIEYDANILTDPPPGFRELK